MHKMHKMETCDCGEIITKTLQMYLGCILCCLLDNIKYDQDTVGLFVDFITITRFHFI